MQPPGSFKLARRTPAKPDPLDRLAPGEARARRIVDSLREELSTGNALDPRIRQVFHDPREVFRLEYEVAGIHAQRTTLLDRETLDDLLDTDAVRKAFESRRGLSQAGDG